MNQLLSSQETERGHNVLKEAPEKNALQRFLAQLNDPLIFFLFIAASISMLLGEYSDTLIILSVILVNALVGVIQEGKAQRALHALKEMSSPKALLIKDGNTTEIPSADLIPGDEVLLDAGRLLPPEELSRETHRSFVEGFALCNDASARIGDPTELALLDMAAGLHVYRPVLETRLPRIDEIPFDSDRKMMTTLHRMGSSSVSYTKGSPDEILKRCTHIRLDGNVVAMTGDGVNDAPSLKSADVDCSDTSHFMKRPPRPISASFFYCRIISLLACKAPQ